MLSNIIVEGDVELFANRKWKQRYCVISKSSNFATHLKLYLFKNRSQCNANAEPFDNVHGSSAGNVKNGKSTTNSIVLTCDNGIVILSFNNIAHYMSWNEIIKHNVSDIDFRVRLVKAENCRLQSGSEGRLHVQKSRLCFYTEPADTCKHMAVWNLSCVRKYFIDTSKNFVFESRAKCDKANGLHHFYSDSVETIYSTMHAACCNRPLPSSSPPRQQPSMSNSYGQNSGGVPALSSSHPLPAGIPNQYMQQHQQQQLLQQQQQRQHQPYYQLQRMSSADVPVRRRHRPDAGNSASFADVDYGDSTDAEHQTVFTFEAPAPDIHASAAAAAAAHDYCNLRDRTSYLSMSDVHPFHVAAVTANSTSAGGGTPEGRDGLDYVRMASPRGASLGHSPGVDDVDGVNSSSEASPRSPAPAATPSAAECDANQYDEVAVDSPPSSPRGHRGATADAASPTAEGTPTLLQQQQQQQRRLKQRPPPLQLQQLRPVYQRSQSEGQTYDSATNPTAGAAAANGAAITAAAAAAAAAAADAELRSPTMRTRAPPQSAGVPAGGGPGFGANGATTVARAYKPRHGGEYLSRERLQSSSSETAGSPPLQSTLPMQSAQPPQLSGIPDPMSVSRSWDYVNLRPGSAAYAMDPPPRLHYAQLQHSEMQQHQQTQHYYYPQHQVTAIAAAAAVPTPVAAPSVAAAPAPISLAAMQQQQHQQHLLNYTEVDHNKTRAFQEIAEEEESRRNPASRSTSSASVNGSKQRAITKIR